MHKPGPTVVLRMRDAAFSTGSDTLVPATTLDVGTGERVAWQCTSPEHAQTLALLAAGIAKASSGTVLVGEYDPRVQPVHCKRLAAYVPHDPVAIHLREFNAYIGYRAALWDLEAHNARARASQILEALGELHEAFAIPLAAALIASPQLLVLDRPQAIFAEAVLRVATGCAIFSTHLDVRSTTAFA